MNGCPKCGNTAATCLIGNFWNCPRCDAAPASSFEVAKLVYSHPQGQLHSPIMLQMLAEEKAKLDKAYEQHKKNTSHLFNGGYEVAYDDDEEDDW